MAQKQVVWSHRASEEFKSILDFYTKRNKSNTYSLKLLSIVDHLISLVQENNAIGRLSDDHITRVLSFEAFLLFYQIPDQTIEIMSIWDNRQNPSNRLDA